MITIIGLGFVGLTTALGFCEKGFKVYGIEISQEKISLLNKFELPFHEPYLKEKLELHISKNNFVVTTEIKHALDNSEIIMICVGTPSDILGKVDLTQVKNAIKNILSHKKESQFLTICIKSTVPPTTCSIEITNLIEEEGYVIGKDIGLCNNPEFLREGYAWDDFIKPDRIVIGSNDDISKRSLNKIYKSFNSEIHNVNLNTAEFLKYSSNTLLATLISFSNELQMIAMTIGDIDIKRSFQLLHEDKRWKGEPAQMSNYVYPGCGFGGYCLPKDTKGIIELASSKGYKANLLNEVININNKIPKFLTKKISQEIHKSERILILGLSFKPQSDDVRSSPACSIIENLINLGYKKLIAYDPISVSAFKKQYDYQIEYTNNLELGLRNTKHAILTTAWPEFKKITKKYKNLKIYDLRFFLPEFNI